MRFKQPRQRQFGFIQVNGGGLETGQSQHDGTIRGVTLAGKGQRSVQRTLNVGRCPGTGNRGFFGTQIIHEPGSRRHRTHRM